jgi:hypothetical protein
MRSRVDLPPLHHSEVPIECVGEIAVCSGHFEILIVVMQRTNRRRRQRFVVARIVLNAVSKNGQMRGIRPLSGARDGDFFFLGPPTAS